MEESRMKFEFINPVIKYDETNFFESLKKHQGSLKGVDFLTFDSSDFLLIEVKNYEGHEKSDIAKIFLKDESEKDLGYACIRKFKDSIYGILLSFFSGKESGEELRNFLFGFFKGKNIMDLKNVELKFIIAINYDSNHSKVKHNDLHAKQSLRGMKKRVKKYFNDISPEVIIYLIDDKKEFKNYYKVIK